MEFIADLHIHSHRSIATSKECVPPVLARSAETKGLQVIGTGDFTHPGWRQELREHLEPCGDGLYKLKGDSAAQVRFVVSGEISTIYKKAGRTRKVHSLILFPDLEAADRLSALLEGIGNIRADGRPILGMDCRTLLEMSLEVSPDVLFVPAHIWTPHFSVLGAASGFNSLEECFGDLTGQITSVETGLSSDPPMNWRLSALDRFTLVSNSDAHSPRNLAREANRFSCEMSYAGIRHALTTRKGFLGTLEFYAEEGKYHLDGHRDCGVSLMPGETIKLGGLCPVCGKKLTIGVLSRVERLADRACGFTPPNAPEFERIVPLATLIGSALGMGEGSQAVERLYDQIVRTFRSELAALRQAPIEDLVRTAGPLVGEAVQRSRHGELAIAAGYDGRYGVITVFDAVERGKIKTGGVLFSTLPERPGAASPAKQDPPEAAAREAAAPYPAAESGGPSDGQRRAAEAQDGPTVIVAGPGSGKTTTLVSRVEHLIRVRQVDPSCITAVTFTRRAAGEMRRRLTQLLGPCTCDKVNVGTFHQLMLQLLRMHHGEALPRLIGDDERREAIARAAQTPGVGEFGEGDRQIGLLKARGLRPQDCAGEPSGMLYHAYQRLLADARAMDYDDVLIEARDLILADCPAWQRYRSRFGHVLVDEFQDVNAVQYDLVIRGVGDVRNLFVIGDPDQSIYSFRGSDCRLFERLTSDFPGSDIIVLDDNYRSAAPIVRAAVSVINRNPGPERGCRPARPVDGRVRHLVVPDERHEGMAIVHEIGRILGGTDMLSAHGQRRSRGEEEREYAAGLGFSDFAVLCRTSRQLQPIEDCFIKEGLPYRVAGRETFLRDPEVRRVLNLLRYLNNACDARMAFLFLKDCAPGDQPIEERRAWNAVLEGTATLDLNAAVDSVYSGGWPEWLTNAYDEVQEFRRLAAHKRPADLIELWINRRHLESHSPLGKLFGLAWGRKRLEDLLQVIDGGMDGDLERKGDTWSEAGAVSLMTLHAAKGLEFEVVFIAGVEEGFLPFGEGQAPEQIEEERRLMFVGMTRARRELVLLSCQRRFSRGEAAARPVSRFLADIPGEGMTVQRWSDIPRAKQLRLFGGK